MGLTDEQYWESFWKTVKIPARLNLALKSERAISDKIVQNIPKVQKDKGIFEIGCAPGKWLIFFYEELGYLPNGCEFVQSAVQTTIENLKINGIKENEFEIIQADFTKLNRNSKYNIVISLGFIEHFLDSEEIFKKHIDFLAEGGFLIIVVPNFRGINKLIQKQIDKDLENKILPSHNLNIMEKSVFYKLGEKYNLKCKFCNYIAGFENSLFCYSAIKSSFKKKCIEFLSGILSRLFKNTSNRYISGYLLGIYQK